MPGPKRGNRYFQKPGRQSKSPICMFHSGLCRAGPRRHSGFIALK
jgi:hypothetical protein